MRQPLEDIPNQKHCLSEACTIYLWTPVDNLVEAVI
jgi:hypothetical protein